MESRPNIVVGIAGGTGSGKTTLAKAIQARLAPLQPLLLHQDSYYRDIPVETEADKENTNFDHPDAFDTDLLVEHLAALKAGQAVRQPLYDFARHARTGFLDVEPARIILLEGILILAEPRLRDILDVPLFVDTPDDIRFMRRLKRDIEARGRSMDSVYRQYLVTVRPMHHQFVAPSKQYARLIIPEGGRNEVAIEAVTSYIQSMSAAPARA